MKTESRVGGTNLTDRPNGAPAARIIARGEGWSIREVVCTLGPRDRPFEEQRADVSISAVIEGSFQYRCAAGKALLHPGAFLLGDAGTCFECGHDHGSGDRCVAFHYHPALFEEIAAGAAGSPRFRFPIAMLPALRTLASLMVELEATARSAAPAATDELAMHVAESVLGAVSGFGETAAATAPRDRRRIGDVLRYIEEHAEQPLDLAALAQIAFMSKYHFLRTFRRCVGVTPYQFLLGLRLRRAALKLRATSLPVSTVALEAGFGDLSTFNGRFRKIFGASPNRFRAAVAFATSEGSTEKE